MGENCILDLKRVYRFLYTVKSHKLRQTALQMKTRVRDKTQNMVSISIVCGVKHTRRKNDIQFNTNLSQTGSSFF